MDTVMEEKRGTYTALSLSLALHVILLLAAGALGLFSIAVPQTGDTPVEVTLYGAGPPAAAAAGDAAPAPAVSAVSDVVIVDKTLPPETPQETPKQTSNPQTSAAAPSKPSDGTQTGTTGSSGGGDTAGTGTKGGTSGTSGGGDAAPTAPPAPPAERVAASLRAEATPEYPQELIEDDVEGSVTVKILVAADGSVESVKLVSSSGYSAMDRAAIAAGYRFQFNPGDNGRKGVFPWTFYFRLE